MANLYGWQSSYFLNRFGEGRCNNYFIYSNGGNANLLFLSLKNKCMGNYGSFKLSAISRKKQMPQPCRHLSVLIKLIVVCLYALLLRKWLKWKSVKDKDST